MAGKPGWGIIATGWIADLFAKDLQSSGHKLVAVGSRTQSSADAFAGRFGIRAHGSYQALVDDPEVDIVYVATPHPMHAADAKLALNAGKHVLIEKPFTLNAGEAQEIADLARAKKRVVLEAMWTRFLPHMLKVREVVASGRLGEIRSVQVNHVQDLPDDPKHRLNAPELGGGALLDLGIYPISFTWDILGAPKTVKAVGRFKETGVDSQVATAFGYDSGAVSATISASDTAGPNTALILGTEARIEIDHTWYEPTQFRVVDPKGKVLDSFDGRVEGRGMQFQAAEIERLIADGQLDGDILPVSETVAIMGTLDEIRRQIGLKYPGE